MKKNHRIVWVVLVCGIIFGSIFWNHDFSKKSGPIPFIKNDRPEKLRPNPDRKIERDPIPPPREPERAPNPKINLAPRQLDLTEHKFSDEDLYEMKVTDRMFSQSSSSRNLSKKFETSFGTFRWVHSSGRYSTDPKSGTGGGNGMTTLQLPDGTWLRDAFIRFEKPVERDGVLYLICYHQVLKWLGDGKVLRVARFEGLETKWAPHFSCGQTKDGLLAGKYLPVCKSCESDFGGLLEYRNGIWIFHPYYGKYTGWAESVQQFKDDYLVIKLSTGDTIAMDQLGGTFADDDQPKLGHF